jgi:hypothetical protein
MQLGNNNLRLSLEPRESSLSLLRHRTSFHQPQGVPGSRTMPGQPTQSCTHALTNADGSLFPFNRKLLEVIKALKPQFLRFPGGAYVEGTDLDTAYKWVVVVVGTCWLESLS